jgi:hypothetical protein
MSWAKLDDRFHVNGKIVAAGNAAVGLFARGISWSAGHETDGFIPEGVARMLESPDQGLVDRLLEIGLLERAEGGYQIHDYLEFNPSARELRRQRKAVADRVRAHRARNGHDTPPSGEDGNGKRNAVRNCESNGSVTRESRVTPGPGTGTGKGSGDPEGWGAGKERASARPELGLLAQRGPIPESFSLTADGSLVLREHGCTNPARCFRAFRVHFLEKASDASTWSDRWDLKLEAWALNHPHMGGACQRRPTPADREREAESRRREARAATRDGKETGLGHAGSTFRSIATGAGK